jgi:hypothetical protein
MAPEDLAHWINMGAVAISTLASATLIEHTALSPVVVEIVPFVKGFALFFWAIATLWIPMLLVLGVWWYLICGVPLAYDPLYWGASLLSMYSVCTYHLAKHPGDAAPAAAVAAVHDHRRSRLGSDLCRAC